MKIEKYEPNKLRSWLNDSKRELAKVKKREYNQNEFLQTAMFQIEGSWQLQQCFNHEAGIASLYNALKLASISGLSLNPLDGEAALIAYKDSNTNKYTASYQKMKNGLIKIAMEDKGVTRIKSEVVRENDVFEITSTDEGDNYTFSPARKNRGEVDGYFACVTTSDGQNSIKYMTTEEILEHREKYAPFYKDNRGEKRDAAWVKSFNGMAIKTVVKAALNNLHLSSETRQAISADENNYQEAEPEQPTVVAGNAEVIKQEEPPPPTSDGEQKMGDII
jgi:phage RecT family recombinase